MTKPKKEKKAKAKKPAASRRRAPPLMPPRFLPKEAPAKPYVEIESYDMTPLYGGEGGVAARELGYQANLVVTVDVLHGMSTKLAAAHQQLQEIKGATLTLEKAKEVSNLIAGVVNQLGGLGVKLQRRRRRGRGWDGASNVESSEFGEYLMGVTKETAVCAP